MFGFFGIPFQCRSAFGTMCYIVKRNRVLRPDFQIYANYFGYDFTSLFHKYRITQTDIVKRYLICIVQRGAFNGSAGKQDRLQVGHRSNSSCTSYLEIHRQKLGGSLLGFEFISGCPAGAFGGHAQCPLQRKIIDFDHHTVCSHFQTGTGRIPIIQKFIDLVQIPAQFTVFGYGETPFQGGFHSLPVGLDTGNVGYQVVKKTIQTATFHFVGRK